MEWSWQSTAASRQFDLADPGECMIDGTHRRFDQHRFLSATGVAAQTVTTSVNTSAPGSGVGEAEGEGVLDGGRGVGREGWEWVAVERRHGGRVPGGVG